MLLKGSTTASYFWDDGSGINGDTGAPASGEPMQKGLAASPSWPMGTKGYVLYHGKRADFFIGDRGPGAPSSKGVMLDLDGKTFAELTGGSWDSTTLSVEGVGGLGHIQVDYVVTEWGTGPGKKGEPVPYSTGAYAIVDSSPAATACSTPVTAQQVGPQVDAALPVPALTAAVVVCALAALAARTALRRRPAASAGDASTLPPPV